MTLLRRFVEDERTKVAASAAPDDADPSPQDAPVPPPPAADAATDTPDPAPAAARAPHPVFARAVAHKTGTPAAADPTLRRTLSILKSLTPVFRAALLYPGVEAGTEAFGQAVHRLASSTAALAQGVADIGDPLEVDTAWARRTVQETCADLVAHHWVSAVIAQGGGEAPQIPLELFVGTLKDVVAMPWPDEGAKEDLRTTGNAAVRLSFLKAFAPVAVEVEKYAEVINRRLEADVVDPAALERVLGQALMEQALQGRNLLMGDDEGSDDDRRMTLQACLAHIGQLYMAAWEPTRGDALGQLVDAPTPEKAREALAGEGFVHGFPFEVFRTRTTEAAKRLLGTTQAAMDMMAPVADPRQRQEG